MTEPLLLELNTRCWLRELVATHNRNVTLSSVPEGVFEAWKGMGLTHVWLMGVWRTGPRSRQRALANGLLREEFTRVLPGWQEADVAGSPYAIECYAVPEALGGMNGLEEFRSRLHQHGLRLILDFIPNHVGLDHAWIQARPDYFVQSDAAHPFAFREETRYGGRWILHGRDPHFAPWDDTAQLDYRRSDVHQAMLDQLLRVAGSCDGVRCDMSMLVLSDVFEKTWKDFPLRGPGPARPTREFWEAAIPTVKAAHSGFLFLAEVYWDMEQRLQDLGFDYTYDKALSDALLRGSAQEVVAHLRGKSPASITRSAHFLENHDEERVASVLSVEEHRPAALLTLALPGMRFLHDGQTNGAVLRAPVQLARRTLEPVNDRICDMYAQLLGAFKTGGVGQGQGQLVPTQPAWADNFTWESILAILWSDDHSRFALVIVNLSAHRAQCRVPMKWLPPQPATWVLADLLSDERWVRSATELRHPGLFLDVAAQAARIFCCQPERRHPSDQVIELLD